MNKRFSGKHILITGGSRGIGRAIAKRFAHEGASITFTHLKDNEMADSLVAELQKLGQATYQSIDVDVADFKKMEALFESFVGPKKLDVLVNNAGIQIGQTENASFDLENFSRVIAVNLTAVAFCASMAIKHFLAQKKGIIINISSVHELVPKPGFLSYSASKAGVGNITRTLALEFASRNIRVNAIGPGATITDMNKDWVNDPERRSVVCSHIPMGRPADAEEIASIAAFLASDDASYVTGQTIMACGGLSLYNDFAKNWAS